MHLVDFTIEIYYDARPYERQICMQKVKCERLCLSHLSETFRINSNFRHAFFSHFSEMNIWVRLTCEEIYCTLLQTRKHRFPSTRSGLAKKVVNFTGNEMYLLKNFSHENIFLKVGYVLNQVS